MLRSYQSRDLDAQIAVHARALLLRKKGLSYSQVSWLLSEEFGTAVAKSTLSYWVRGMHEPLGRAHDFRPAPKEELAYLIGVQKGDCSLDVNAETHNHRIRLQSIDHEFIAELDRCLSRVLGSARHALWQGAGRREIRVVGSSFLLHKFLSQSFSKLKPFVEHCNDCVAAS